MTHQHHDMLGGDDPLGSRDPLRAAFDSHRRAPRDVVPSVAHSIDDLRHLADGGTKVQVTHYEMSDSGVTRHTEWTTITSPVTQLQEETH
jgi:hypothetical protein